MCVVLCPRRHFCHPPAVRPQLVHRQIQPLHDVRSTRGVRMRQSTAVQDQSDETRTGMGSRAQTRSSQLTHWLVLALCVRCAGIRVNSPQSSWDLTQRADVQPVPGGLVLSEAGSGGAAAAPTLLVDVSTLATTRLQLRQEDFSRSRGEDDLGGFSLPIEQSVDKAWRQEKAIVSPAATQDAGAASAASSPVAAAAPSSSAVSAASVDGWYPVSIDSAPLLDRVSGRHLGDVSLKLSVQLEPYLRHLVASQSNLHLLSELVSHWLMESAPSADTPLRHLLLDQVCLSQLVGFIVASASDKGSMDGQRLRERVYPALHKALDVFGSGQAQMLPLLFSQGSAVWRQLFGLRRCVATSSLPSSSGGWALYAGLVEAFLGLAERAISTLEPPPPPPPKSAEEIDAQRIAEEAAEKKRAAKARKAAKAAAAAGGDGEDEPPLSGRGSSAGSVLSSPSSKQKKSGLAAEAEPPALPASRLCFGLASIDILREVFQATHVRLGGSSRRASSVEIDWASASEAKLAELSQCCDLLWRLHGFLLRYGDEQGSRPTVEQLRPALFGVGVSGGTDTGAGTDASGDPHALWLQKVLGSIVKKARDTLANNRDLFAKLQQHADRFAKHYPTEVKPKKTKQ